MKQFCYLICMLVFAPELMHAQNVGIGTTTATEKLEVLGNIKATGVVITNGGNQGDFITKSNSTGNLGYRKGFGAQAIRYMICIEGLYPSQDFGLTGEPFIGEIKMFAGTFAPKGWRFCEGQLLPISQNTALFSLIGTMYGGNGQTNFALPDLRGASPVGTGTNPSGFVWTQGQITN